MQTNAAPVWSLAGLVGLGLGLGGGAVVAFLLVWSIRGQRPQWSALSMGLAERLFFTPAAAFVPATNIVPTMAAWIAAKMAYGWLRDKRASKQRRLSGLAGTTASMAFALIGGLVVSGDLVWTR